MTRAQPTTADWRSLATHLTGQVVLPADDRFAEVSALVDPWYDNVTPAAVVRCADTADVVAALELARRHGLPVVVRSGGHSAAGASTVAGGLVIDVRPMDRIEIEPDGTAVVEAGVTHEKLYAKLAAHDRVLPAGLCATVGVAGLTLGGGIGMLTRKYGLTCDSLQAVTVVTVDGSVRAADPDNEPELYWACRGGGGGLAGVVTRLRFRTYPAPALGAFSARWTGGHVATVVESWQRWIDTAPEEVTAELELQAHSDGRISALVAGVSCDADPRVQLDALVAEAECEPVSASVRPAWRLSPLYPVGRLADGLTSVQGGDLLPRRLPSEGVGALTRVLAAAAEQGLAMNASLDPLGGAAARVPAGGTAWPWRGAFASVFWRGEVDRTRAEAARGWLAAAHEAVAPWSAGAYVNLLDASRGDGRTYFGSHVSRLRAVKDRYDPTGVFVLPYRL